MRFLIVDNQGGELDSLILALKKSYPGTYIAPKPGTTTSRWSDAEHLVMSEAKDDVEQVIFSDLALDTDKPDDARAGLDRFRALFDRRPKATWIAFTSFTEVIDLDEARNLFAAVLNKQQWSQHRKPDDRAIFVRTVVDTALSKREGANSRRTYDIEDSLGIRTFFAAFPDPTLDVLVGAECRDWSHITVRALSAGYSGSSLLSLSGDKDRAPRHLVVKIAARPSIIDRETRVLDEFLGEGQDFAAMCARPRPIKQLPEHLGVYAIQEALPGPTLASLWDPQRKTRHLTSRQTTAMRAVIDIELSQYGRGWTDPKGDDKRKQERIALTPIDLYRAKKSCTELLPMAQVIAKKRGWPVGIPSPTITFKRIERLLAAWPNVVRSTPPLYWVLQHGDLNPHNVILGEAGQITFIDLARLDQWPVGYDLCRLAIQLRIRLVDRSCGVEWVQNNLPTWGAELVFDLGNTDTARARRCPPAALCEQQLGQWIAKHSNSGSVLAGINLCIAMDLVRIISYADLAPFKRLWAAINLARVYESLT